MRTKERKIKNTSAIQKKVTSNQVIKSEDSKPVAEIKEKEVTVKNTEAKVQSKPKETTKKTSARKSAATKTLVKPEEKQETVLKTQSNKDIIIDKTKKE